MLPQNLRWLPDTLFSHFVHFLQDRLMYFFNLWMRAAMWDRMLLVITYVTEGGWRLCFHPPVCLSVYVCDQVSPKCCAWIRTKFGGELGYVARTTWLYFGEDLDPGPRIF